MRRRKRLHVLGGGLWQVPTIKLAKSLGHEVFVTDIYSERPGYAYADTHEVVDIRDREGTLAAAMRNDIDGIICDTTDVGVATAAFVAERLRLPGIGLPAASRFTNKRLMREATATAGIDNPRFAVVSDSDDCGAIDKIGFPLVIKPVDSQSSRGVAIVHHPEDCASKLRAALNESNCGQVLVEEWIDGTEVTVEAMCWNGTVHTLAISDKEHYDYAPQIASRLTYPAAMASYVLDKITVTNARVLEILGLNTGVAHSEYIVTPDDRVVLVEAAARGGGSRIYSHIAPYMAGIDLPKYYIEYVLGSSQPWPKPISAPRAAILDFFNFPSGTVRSIRGVDEARKLPGIADLAIEIEEGQVFGGAHNDRNRPGYLVAFGGSREEVVAISARAKEMIAVDIIPC